MQKRVKFFPLSLVVALVVCLLCAGYWIYQVNVRDVIYATTVSFMEQIAEHDQQNMLNQIESKWVALTTITNRVRAARKYTLEEVFSDLKLNVVSGAFQRLYLITDQGTVYAHTALKTNLADMAWKEDYQNAEGAFATIYRETSREHWGEYMVCGAHLPEPIQCGGETITGIVGLVPISAIAEQMRLESFGRMGVTVIMQANGDIITSSTVYDSDVSNNYMNFLAGAELQDGVALEGIRAAVGQGQRQLFRFSLDGEGFYTLIEPLGDDYHSGWHLVVQLSEKITNDQVERLLTQSLVFFVLIGIACLALAVFINHKMNEVKTLRIVEQTKTRFLTNMSHEIRTPLNGISGLCYLMQQNLDDREKMAQYLEKTVASAAFLQDVINDVLDMSKIESGQLELAQRDLDLKSLLGEVQTLLETQAQAKGIHFTLDMSGVGQAWITGDPIRIKQILMNILGNAIKFTPQGGRVSLTASQAVSGGTATTTFVVEDDGCGMSPEFLTRIWQPFEQENRQLSKNGTGLGTTISKNLVEKMQGAISVRSRPREGSTFTITIPFPIAQRPPAQDQRAGAAAVNLKGKRILSAEDNELNRMILSTILQEQGCLLTEAFNGKEAVDLFEASAPGAFDLILMDLQMPVMDGCEAARRIRQSSHPDAGAIAIFAVTANAFQEDLRQALAAGMNDVVTKPLNIAALLDKIARIEGERA